MPTYEYACAACGHKFEEFQSIKAKPLTVCPKCKKRKVKRLISSGAGFIFKGSGFYITDYRSEGYKADAKSDAGGGKTETAAKSDSKSDSKSETKSETTTKTEAPKAEAPKSESKSAASKASSGDKGKK